MIFHYDERLGISIPKLHTEWENLDTETQTNLLMEWEKIRGDIPYRIKQLEETINKLQMALYEEDDFEKSCEINDEIANVASIINDLWIWYRTDGEISDNEKLHL